MDDVDRIERTRIKAFCKLLVDRLGAEVWAKRKAAYVKRIREKKLSFNIKLPIESQLFIPADDDIDWHILASYLAYDFPFSDSAYSSWRVYTYAMAIGAVAHQFRNVPSIDAVLDKMIENNNQPEKQLFELLTASFYLKNGYEVSFIPENSITWPDGKRKPPDMLVKMGEVEFYVECKRADKKTKYSWSEEEAWASIWSQLSHHMLKAAPWNIIYLTFHNQIADVLVDEVVKLADLAIKAGGKMVRVGSVSGKVRAIDKMRLIRHYKEFSVRAGSPQQELLVFGDVHSNEKRSIATIAARVIRPDTPEDILNMFVEDVDHCVGAQWRFEHEISLFLRSKHFKSLVTDGVIQIPPDRPGILHIWYETRDGVEIEELRRAKNVENISNFDASGTTMLGVFVHAVNYYPFESNYEWAETVQDFSRIPDLIDLFPFQTLMLASSPATSVEGTTHWAPDKAKKSRID